MNRAVPLPQLAQRRTPLPPAPVLRPPPAPLPQARLQHPHPQRLRAQLHPETPLEMLAPKRRPEVAVQRIRRNRRKCRPDIPSRAAPAAAVSPSSSTRLNTTIRSHSFTLRSICASSVSRPATRRTSSERGHFYSALRGDISKLTRRHPGLPSGVVKDPSALHLTLDTSVQEKGRLESATDQWRRDMNGQKSILWVSFYLE